MKTRSIFSILMAAVLVITGITLPYEKSTAALDPVEKSMKEDPDRSDGALSITKTVRRASFYSADGKHKLIKVRYDRLEADSKAASSAGVEGTGAGKALETVNKNLKDEDKDFIKENKKMARKDYENRKQDRTFVPYICRDHLYVVRNDGKFLSIKRLKSTYQGGAHGSDIVTAYNFDAVTGKRIKLSDVFSYGNADKLASMLAREVVKQNDRSKFDFGTKGLKKSIKSMIKDKHYNRKNDTGSLTWYMNDNGVTFFFNQYDIASYAAGTFKVKITEKNLSSLK